jgi:hypothetical protein
MTGLSNLGHRLSTKHYLHSWTYRVSLCMCVCTGSHYVLTFPSNCQSPAVACIRFQSWRFLDLSHELLSECASLSRPSISYPTCVPQHRVIFRFSLCCFSIQVFHKTRPDITQTCQIILIISNLKNPSHVHSHHTHTTHKRLTLRAAWRPSLYMYIHSSP